MSDQELPLITLDSLGKDQIITSGRVSLSKLSTDQDVENLNIREESDSQEGMLSDASASFMPDDELANLLDDETLSDEDLELIDEEDTETGDDEIDDETYEYDFE